MFSITQHDVELSRPIVILGAGLSGLSLADALVERGCRAPIVLVDRRRGWTNDRTWCTWLTGPLRHAELARHRWWSWQLRRGGDAVIAHARAHPYIQIEAATLYDRVLTRLQALPGVEIRTGERVRALHPDDDGPVVDTDRERLRAATVVDALGSSSPLRGTPSGAELALSQRLLGWEIETERPVFDPRMATLMDFTSAGPSGVEFVYRLPFDATHALVEHTSIGRGGPDADVRRAALTHDCDRLAGPGAWRIVREEQGVIPMTTARFPHSHGPRTFTVGGAAGAVRPSSGYAFTRIQRHVETVADAIIAGDDPPASVAPARLHLLDRMFLTALRDAPDGGEDLFWRLGRSVDADAFARFMTDVSSPWDELRIARALPPLRMLAAGARSLR